jgi:hypothetical protein
MDYSLNSLTNEGDCLKTGIIDIIKIRLIERCKNLNTNVPFL